MEIAFQSNSPRWRARARRRMRGGVKSKDKFYKNRIGDERHRAVVKIHRWIFHSSMYLHGRARTRAHRRTYRRVPVCARCVHTDATWSTPIRARAAPFVLKLEVTKRILTSLATSFYSPAFRCNVQRGFSMAATSARRRAEGWQEGAGRRTVGEYGLRDGQVEKEYEGWQKEWRTQRRTHPRS